MQGVKFKWDNAKKTGDGSSFFVGTSPAFDFAIFSACALSLFKEKDIEVCTCKIHKSELEVTARQIKIKFKKAFVATGKISTAYPSSVAGKFGIVLAGICNDFVFTCIINLTKHANRLPIKTTAK